MSVEIKTAVLKQKRHTFNNLVERFGEDRPASRYEEGTYDLQSEENFHYRPLWAPDFEIFDKRRTRITMRDWYSLRDPRQYYYATYNIARAGQIDAVEHNFAMVERRGMMTAVPAAWMEKIVFYLLPLRHYEWGANMNNCAITVDGYGSALTAATCFAMGDRLGIAQIIGRIGLALAANQETALDAAKDYWMTHPAWQPMRQLVEDTLVVGDPIELFIAQNLVMDALVYPVIYGAIGREGDRQGGAAISFLTAFMSEWYDEIGKWVDATVKTLAADNGDNKVILRQWADYWRARVIAAVKPVAGVVLGEDATETAVAEALAALDARIVKAGL